MSLLCGYDIESQLNSKAYDPSASKNTVRHRIQLLATKGKKILFDWQTKGGAQPFHTALTTDAWTSKAGDGYIVLTAHLIDDAWSMHSYTAGIVSTGILGHTALQHGEELRSLILNAGITDIPAITVDTEATMQSLGGILGGLASTIFCSDHMMNLVAWSIIKHPSISHLVEDMRTYVNSFRKSSQARSALKQLMRAAGRKPLGLVADVVTRWWSTFSMVHRLVELREFLVREEHITDVELVQQHWQVAKALVHVLKPLRDFQVAMEAEKHVTLSLVPVCLETVRQSMDSDSFMLQVDGSSLRSDLRISPTVANLVAAALDAGRASFVSHFRSKTERLICTRAPTVDPTATGRMRGIPSQAWMAMLLDPRVKHLTNFLSAEEVDDLWSRLHDLMGLAYLLDGTTDEDEGSDAVVDGTRTPRPKRARREGVVNEMLSSVAKFATDDRRHLQRQSRAERDSHLSSEITKYRMMRPSAMSDNPLSFWKSNEGRFPSLARQAKRFLCQQPTNGASERRNSELSLLIRSNRSRLAPKMVEDIHALKGFFRFLETNPDALSMM
jgi:hypothetical protein